LSKFFKVAEPIYKYFVLFKWYWVAAGEKGLFYRLSEEFGAAK
jgi:hypothetical protein